MHLYLGGRDDWLVLEGGTAAAPCCALRAAAVASSALTIENC